ncbi:mucin-5AC-like [Prionailurus viverrinus]|uniref:mucin-5AC-like n=1 Tax=Prionailurus viverrinus TaxID=61388 RepID=UPI001FF1D250|nr:mucin-5AC-like [Prionailurus viverrinus]
MGVGRRKLAPLWALALTLAWAQHTGEARGSSVEHGHEYLDLLPVTQGPAGDRLRGVTILPPLRTAPVVRALNPAHNGRVCSTWGDFHYKTFDGDVFRFPGLCNYVLSAHCGAAYEDFNVQVRRGLESNVTTLARVTMKLDGMVIELTKSSIQVNGLPIQLPFSQSGVIIEHSSSHLKVVARLGLVFMWSQDDSLLLELDAKYSNQTCGLCGDFNGVPVFDEFLSHGVKLTPIEFGNLQKLHGPTEQCQDPAPVPPLTCSLGTGICEEILSSWPFRGCNALVDASSYVQACRQDLCLCEHAELTSCVCHTVAEYSRQCAHAGGRPLDWRGPDLCPQTCPLNMQYRECGSPCADTCSNPEHSQLCEDHCMAGCFCPEGTVLDDIGQTGCIPAPQCACVYNGATYAPGAVYSTDCANCTCSSGRWSCQEVPCPGTCSVLGGAHFSTFDERQYTVHGDCSYVLAKPCDSSAFTVLAELRRCGLTDSETCLKSLTLSLDGGHTVIVVKASGEVFVNQIYTQMPVSAANVTLFRPSTFFIIAQTNLGLQLDIQLVPMMQVFLRLAPELRGLTCGLCGNFNQNQADDFRTLSGVVEGTAAAFANTWKTQAACPNVKNSFEDPCSLSVENEKYAQHWCSRLKDPHGPFAQCHAAVSPGTYHSNCMFDTCNCQKSEDCLCAALSSYVRACAAKGVLLRGWRDGVCAKPMATCPKSLTYQYHISSCQPTCRARSHEDVTCGIRFVPVDGCACPQGTFMDEAGKCVPASSCPCYHEGSVVPNGESLHERGAICTCTQGLLSCIGGHTPAPVCTPPMVYVDCRNATPGAAGAGCQKSCLTLDMECYSPRCEPGCVCPDGLVADGEGGCVAVEDCPCVHDEASYLPGQTVRVGCNTCTCKSRMWQCTREPCLATCTVYGDGHYITFDGRSYSFSGDCAYTLLQDHCGGNSTANGTFRVVTENVPCGTTGVTCSKDLKLFLGSYELKLSGGKVEVIQKGVGQEAPYSIRQMGIYLVVDTEVGLVLLWDRKTSIFLKLSPEFKGRVCGLCGNFDDNAVNDFTTRSQSVVGNALEFGNSWKFSPSCADAPSPRDACAANPHRKSWAQKQCSVLNSATFAACHAHVEPAKYYEACVGDACACDSGGDCECLCTAVAAYAQACHDVGVCVSWRTPDICPLFCDYYNREGQCEWHYQPCGPPCMRTCRNPSGRCLTDLPGLEGCYPKCPQEAPIFDEDRMQCVATCPTPPPPPPCRVQGKSYRPGEMVPSDRNCQSCVCSESGVQCAYDTEACVCTYDGRRFRPGDVIYHTTDGTGGCISARCSANGTIDRRVYPCSPTTPTPPTTFSFSTPPLVVSSTRPAHTCHSSAKSTVWPSTRSGAPSSTPGTTSGPPTSPPRPHQACGEDCWWSPWLDVSHPGRGIDSGDFDTLENLRAHGHQVCPTPKRVECRAEDAPEVPIQVLGQHVECSPARGLTCYNRKQASGLCYNYQIKVQCCFPRTCPTSGGQTQTATPVPGTTTTTLSTSTPYLYTCPRDHYNHPKYVNTCPRDHYNHPEYLYSCPRDHYNHPEYLYTCPKYPYTCPRDHYNHPEYVYTCPRDHYNHPKYTYTCPRDHYNHPEYLYTCPRDHYNHPEYLYTCPKYPYTCPRDHYNHPEYVYTCPRDHYNHPEYLYSYPRDHYNHPNTSTPVPGTTTTTPIPLHLSQGPLQPPQVHLHLDHYDHPEYLYSSPRDHYNHPEYLYSCPRDHYNHPEYVYTCPRDHYNHPEYPYTCPRDHYNHPEYLYPCPRDHYNHPEYLYSCPRDHYNHPEYLYTCPRDHYNHPEYLYSCPRDHYNHPEYLYTCPRDHYNHPKYVYPCPRDHYNHPEYLYSCPRDHYNHPEYLYSCPRDHYNHPEYLYTCPRDHYNHPKYVYPCPRDHYNHPEYLYSCPRDHYNHPKYVYPCPRDHYNHPEYLYSCPRDHYNHPEYVYTCPRDHYDHPEYLYSSPRDHYDHPEYLYTCPRDHYDHPEYLYTCPRDHYNHPEYLYTCPKPMPVSTTPEPCLQKLCNWTQWFDSSYPGPGINGGDFDTFHDLRAKGHKFCEKPSNVECRAQFFPNIPLEELGQDLICDKSLGLLCLNRNQLPPICYNYEIRIECCELVDVCRSTTHPVTSETTYSTREEPGTQTQLTWTTGIPSSPTRHSTASSVHAHPTTSITTGTHSVSPAVTIPCQPQCTWTKWFDVDFPSPGPHGGDTETFGNIVRREGKICRQPEYITRLECRAESHPEVSIETLGQVVECNVSKGLVCRNRDQGGNVGMCLNYEVRMLCCEPPEYCSTHKTVSVPHTSSVSTTRLTEATSHLVTSSSTSVPKTSSTSVTESSPTSVTETSSTSVTETSSTSVTETRPTSVTETSSTSTSPTSVTETSPTSVTETSSTSVTETSPTSVTETSPTSVTETSSTSVTETSPTSVTETSPTSVTETSPTSVTETSSTLVTETSPTSVTETSPTSVTETSTSPVLKTETTHFTPVTIPCQPQCRWTKWFDVDFPSPGPHGGDADTLGNIVRREGKICRRPEYITRLECRVESHPEVSIETLGQVVECNVSKDLVCRNRDQSGEVGMCNYEVRVLCCEPPEHCPRTSVTPYATPSTKPSSPPEPTSVVSTTTCYCSVSDKVYRAGSVIYNRTDLDGHCYYATCSLDCHVVRTHYTCASGTTPPVPTTSPAGSSPSASAPVTAQGCPNAVPPRRKGETWAMPNCSQATCEGNGVITLQPRPCPQVQRPTCANGYPPVKVVDPDSCCPQYRCQCVCSGWGDPHYITFDGTYYTFLDNCTYVLVQQILPVYGHFRVLIDNYFCGAEDGLSCPQSIIVEYQQDRVVLTRKPVLGVMTNEIIFNDKVVKPGFQKDGVSVSQIGIKMYLTIPELGVQVMFSGLIFSVELPFSKFANNTEGQCGTCTNDKKDECRLPGGTVVPSCSDMSGHWKVTTPHQPPCHGPPPKPTAVGPTPSPAPCLPSPICQLILSEVFELCHPLIPPLAFYQGCTFDHCHLNDSNVLCSSLELYASLCASRGVCIDWRRHTNHTCSFTCPADKVYLPCGPSKPSYCYGSDNTSLVALQDAVPITEGCFCPENMTHFSMSSPVCVPADCHRCLGPHGEAVEPGYTISVDCQRCTCENSTLTMSCHRQPCPLPPACPLPGFVPVPAAPQAGQCCPQYNCACDTSYCPKPVACPEGSHPVVTYMEGACCPSQNCSWDVCSVNGTLYQPGSVVSSSLCETCRCEVSSSPQLDTVVISCETQICNTHCPAGFEYQEQSGQCCGLCVQQACVVNASDSSTRIFYPGQSWPDPTNPCVTHECEKHRDGLVVVTRRKACPPLNCPAAQAQLSEDGCCLACPPPQPQNQSACAVYYKREVIVHGDCRSPRPTRVAYCQGNCGDSSAKYSLEANTIERNCSCCRELRVSPTTVTLRCKDGSSRTFGYTLVKECGCVGQQCGPRGNLSHSKESGPSQSDEEQSPETGHTGWRRGSGSPRSSRPPPSGTQR